MEAVISDIKFKIPSHLKWQFQNKCEFYELNQSNILIFFIKKFLSGEYDKDLNVPLN